MAVFRLRTYTEIISAMLNTMRSLRGMGVDLNRGSVNRTMLEAAALQDAEQYVQMSRILDLFSPDDCKGEDLDRRFLDFGSFFNEEIGRLGALTSVGDIKIGDTNFPVAFGLFAADTPAGATSFDIVQSDAPNDFATIAGGSVFMVRAGRPEIGQEEMILVSMSGDTMTILSPIGGLVFTHRSAEPIRLAAIATQLAGTIAPGATTATVLTGTGSLYPVGSTVIFDRDVVGKRESKLVATQVGDTITWSGGTSFQHLSGSIVHRSTTGSDRALSAGLNPFVPIGFGTQQINFITTSSGTLLDGDRESVGIPIESKIPGSGTVVAAGLISQIQTKPFVTATVVNPTSTIRGKDREEDSDFLLRGKKLLQSLSRGTRTALEARTVGLIDPVTQKSVVFSQDVEPVGYGVSNLYITDGSTDNLSAMVAVAGREVLISKGRNGDRRARLGGQAPYAVVTTPADQVNPRLFKSMDRGVATATASNSLTDTNHSTFTGSYIGRILKTVDDRFFQITGAAGFTLTLNAGGVTPPLDVYSIFDFSGNPLMPSVNNPLDVGADYGFDPTTGDLELTVANQLVLNDSLVAVSDNDPNLAQSRYRQSTGLIAFVQKVVNGDKTDSQNFPGIKATGTQVYVLSPAVVYVDITVQIVPQPGFTLDQLRDTVTSSVQVVVNKSGIGSPLVLSDIIVALRQITGVSDVRIIFPTENQPGPVGAMIRVQEANITVV